MHPNAQILKITSKQALCDGVFLFKMQMPQNLDFIPGQFVVLQLGDRLFRSYSIVDIKDNTLELLIDIKVGGEGSKFFENSQIGTELGLLGKPSGHFKIANTKHPKIFVATGTGLAPFVPMIKHLIATHPEISLKLYFGCRHLTDQYATELFSDCINHPTFEIIPCITRDDQVAPPNHKGRVTDIIPTLEKDFFTTEYYLCGNPQMVESMNHLLHQKGATTQNIFFEKYGS